MDTASLIASVLSAARDCLAHALLWLPEVHPDLREKPEGLAVAGAALVPLLLLISSLLPARAPRKASSESGGGNNWKRARVVKTVAATPLLGRSPSLPPPTALPRPVDLTGSWVNVSIRGDMHAYMVSMGAHFLVRQEAKAQEFGVGKMRNVISRQSNLHLLIEMNFPFVQSIELELDGREREYGTDPFGRSLRYCARWEGAELVAYRGGVLLWKRALEGKHTMLWHLYDSAGTRVTRVFAREQPGTRGTRALRY